VKDRDVHTIENVGRHGYIVGLVALQGSSIALFSPLLYFAIFVVVVFVGIRLLIFHFLIEFLFAAVVRGVGGCFLAIFVEGCCESG
jgi:hypothetical protein